MDGSSSWAQELALATGGRNVRGTERLDLALASVVEESLSYYILGFEPDAGAEPDVDRLRDALRQLLGPADEYVEVASVLRTAEVYLAAALEWCGV